MHRQSKKNLFLSLLYSNISTCPHNMVNLGPLMAEICWRVWGTPANFNGFASWLRYCTDVAQRRSTKLCRMFGHLLGWYTIYTFLGILPLTEFCQVQNSLCVQVSRSPTGSVTARHSSSGRAAITLGIGPHSSYGRPTAAKYN